MPYAQNNDTKIYWEESGAGEPLLLIMGLGGTSKEWRRLLPALTGKYRVIVFDNRGAGEVVITEETFSIPLMAADARRSRCGWHRIGARPRNVYGRNDRAGIRLKLS